MEEAIKNFGKQFDYVPEIINKENLKSFKHIVLLGMGGSHLAADIAKNILPDLDIFIHRDYGLPKLSEEFMSDSVVVASSYSGNTEEVIDGLKEALIKNYYCVVVSVGGKLIEMAKENNLPFIQIPDTKIQPRSALGFALISFAHILRNEKLIEKIENLRGKINPLNLQEEGKKLAEDLKGFVPIIYSSTENFSIAYNWKIKLNETGKIPAFYNIFPELNHNEMTGFDINDQNRLLSDKFAVIFLADKNDHPQIQKRMEITKKLYDKKGLKTTWLEIKGVSIAEKIFNSLILADWVALYTSSLYGSEANEVPMVEEFKKLIA